MNKRFSITRYTSMLAILLALILYGCEYYGVQNISETDIENIESVNSGSNVFLKDSTCIYFSEGFYVNDNVLSGKGRKYSWRKNNDNNLRYYAVPLDSVARVEYRLYDSFWYNFDSLH